MKPAHARSVKFTYEDFLNFRDDGRRHEIIDGEHFVTPSPDTKHQTVSMNLSGALRTYLTDRPVGAVFAAPFDVVLSELDVVQPDLIYISRARAGILTEQHVRGAPDLVVEILSPGTRRIDEITKRKLYEGFGVAEYWIVDPELEMIKMYRHTAEGFTRIAELTAEAGDEVRTPLLPGLSIPLAALFAPAL